MQSRNTSIASSCTQAGVTVSKHSSGVIPSNCLTISARPVTLKHANNARLVVTAVVFKGRCVFMPWWRYPASARVVRLYPLGLKSLPRRIAACHHLKHFSFHNKIIPPILKVLNKGKGTLESPWSQRRQDEHHTCFYVGSHSPQPASRSCWSHTKRPRHSCSQQPPPKTSRGCSWRPKERMMVPSRLGGFLPALSAWES